MSSLTPPTTFCRHLADNLTGNFTLRPITLHVELVAEESYLLVRENMILGLVVFVLM